MLEYGDGCDCKGPVTTSNTGATNVSVSDGPPHEHKIEWENSVSGKSMLASGCHAPNELDNTIVCVLYGMKARFYCFVFSNKTNRSK